MNSDSEGMVPTPKDPGGVDGTPSNDEPSISDGETTAGSPDPLSQRSHLRRSVTHRMIGGVAGGIAERLAIEPTVVRVVFVILSCLWGFGIAVYVAMWILLPSAEDEVGIAHEHEPHPRWLSIALGLSLVALALIASATCGRIPRLGIGTGVLWLIYIGVLAILVLRSERRRMSLGKAVAGVFLLLSSLVILFAAVFFGVLDSTGVSMAGGTGTRLWQPSSISETVHVYRTEFGASTVDLTAVKFPASGFALAASVAVGELIIEVPMNAVVNVKTHVGIGSISYDNGPNSFSTGTFQVLPSGLSPTQLRRAPHLSIDAEVGFGHIQVDRGSTFGAN